MENCSSPVQSAPRPQSSIQRPANESNNTNNITISLPQQQFPEASCQSEVKAITLQPQPIQLYVDTPTDWPQIIIGGVVALSVGFMAYSGQRNQVRASQAAIRNEWQKDFKKLIEKFISASVRISIKTSKDKNYQNNPLEDYNVLFSMVIESQVGIEIILDRTKPYSGQIISLAEEIVDAIRGGDDPRLERLVNKFIDVANGVVEKCWQDIREDLEGGKNKWWRFFIKK